MRGLAAIVVSWLLWGVLDQGIYTALAAAAPDRFPAGQAPDAAALLLLLLVLRAGYSFVAGNVAARIAGRNGSAVGWAAAVLLITGIVVQASTWSIYPVWYHALFLLSIVPAALAGASLVAKPEA